MVEHHISNPQIDCSPRYPECNSHVTLQGSFMGYFESAITPPGDGCQGVSSLAVALIPLQGSEIYMCYPCGPVHSHYNPGGFPRICAVSDFPPPPKRGTELDSGYSGERSIAPCVLPSRVS